MKFEIGSKIRKIRQDRNIKQEELAHFLIITQSALSKLENDASYIKFEQIINIANYTKAAPHEFFPDDLINLQQISFRIELQDLQNELEYQKDVNKQFLKRMKSLERIIEEKDLEILKIQSNISVK